MSMNTNTAKKMEEMDNCIKETYTQVYQYVSSGDYPYASKALSVTTDILDDRIRNSSQLLQYKQEFLHCLEICIMLMDLHIPIEPFQEDILLCAVIMHIYPENFTIDDLEWELVVEMGLCREVYEIVDAIRQDNTTINTDYDLYYKKIQENRLALLAALADRGNIIQKLYQYSTWNAHRYIDETKICYYPMCIYGKEHYHELLGPISVLKEKIKSLLEMEEILLQRYEVREAELIRDILDLREENATIRGIIAKFQGE